MENVQKVTFYHRGGVPPISFHHGKIVMADGKESYFPLASAFIMRTDRTTSGLSTTILDSVPFENEPSISLSRIRTLEVSRVLSSPSPFLPMCKAELKVTDMYDDVVTDTVYGNLTVCVLTKKGAINTKFSEIKRIEFFEE